MSVSVLVVFYYVEVSSKSKVFAVCSPAARNAAYGCTNTENNNYCEIEMRVISSAPGAGGWAVTIEYALKSDDNARRFTISPDYSVEPLVEPGNTVSSAQGCEGAGLNANRLFWDGNTINPNSNNYTGLFQSLLQQAGQNYVPRADAIVYGGIQSGLTRAPVIDADLIYWGGICGNNLRDPFNGVGSIDSRHYQPYVTWRTYLGIDPCAYGDVLGGINDSGAMLLGGFTAWCVGMDYSYLKNTPECRYLDAAKIYYDAPDNTGGADWAGFLNRSKNAAIENFSSRTDLLGTAFKEYVRNGQDINGFLGYRPGFSTGFQLSLIAQNTRDAIGAWLAPGCAGAPPDRTWISVFNFLVYCDGGGIPTVNLNVKASGYLTFVMRTPRPNPVPACSLSPFGGTYEVGSPFTVNGNVYNNAGAYGLDSTGLVYYYLDGRLLGSQNMGAVPAGGNKPFSFSVTINDAGTHIISANYNGITCSQTGIKATSRPYVRFYGSDVSVGSPTTGDCPGWSTKDNLSANNGKIWAFNLESAGGYVGSGTQFGAMALSDITGFGSSGSSAKRLTFANTIPADPYGGNYGAAFCPPNYWNTSDAVPLDVSGNTLNVGSNKLVSGTSYYIQPKDTPVNITCSNGDSAYLDKTKTIKIYIDGDVRICNDIYYKGSEIADPWTAVNDIPNLWIIAKGNIYIDPSVKKMSGTYIAMPRDATKTGPTNGGYIYTCAIGLAAPDTSQIVTACNSSLSIYGSLIAKTIKLFRSNNSLRDATANESYLTSKAAEIITTGPESWIAESLSSRGKATTTFDAITSLPPIL